MQNIEVNKETQRASTYQKIPGIYKRQEHQPFDLLEGQFKNPEIEMLKDLGWVFTEKIDGMNIRVIWDGYRVSLAGRTDRAQIPDALAEKLNDLFLSQKVEQVFEQIFPNKFVVLYGEGYGSGIQSGGKYSSTQEFILFDVKVDGIFLSRKDVEDVANTFGLDVVPIVFQSTIDGAIEQVRDGLKSKWGDFLVEGVVGKLPIDLLNRRGDRVVVKIKSNEFYKDSKGSK